MKKVLVTGANGHVGLNLVKHLVDQGYQVRASVRDASDPKKIQHLKDLPVELVSLDIMNKESAPAAVAGMDGVFHVAAVYKTYAKNPQKEIIDPSVIGAMNVLMAAHEAGVKKVVMTSSSAAVGSDGSVDKPLTEDDWNDDTPSPYYQAKTRAERAATKFSNESGLNVVFINPCAVLGPDFYSHTPSTRSFEAALRGKLPAVPPIGFSMVDVRDVAIAHRLAYEHENAKGRYIVAAKYMDFFDLLHYIKAEHRPDMPAPKSIIPIPVLKGLAYASALAYKLFNVPPQVMPDFVKETAGKKQILSSKKIETELGWQARPFNETMEDTLVWIENNFINK